MATILLGDEDDVLRAHARRILETDGHRVFAVHNGLHALQVCEERPGEIELLVVPWRLPDMRGWELHRLAQGSHPGLTALFTAGKQEATGDRPVLRKPFSSQQLRERIRRELTGAGASP